MAINTNLLRSFLDDAWDDSQASNPVLSLRQKLRENETASRKAIAGGSLASISANGRTTAFSNNGTQQEDVVIGWRALVDLYDKIKTRDALDSDADIYAGMMFELQPVTECRNDFSLARCCQ